MKIKDWHKKNKKNFSLSEINFIFKNLEISQFSFLSGQEKALTNRQIKVLNKIEKGRLKKVPLALSLGREDFLGKTFQLGQTLIPRPETELLVEEAQNIIKANNLKVILDLGCGCGNIGISLDKFFYGKLKIYLSDVSKQALATAKKNALKFNSKVKIIRSDLFTAFKQNSFDLIVANPPYVESKNIKGSLIYEPKEALDGGSKGTFFLEEIIKQAHKHLKKDAYLIVEFGYRQKTKLIKIINKNNKYRIKKWIKDYAGIWRGVILQKEIRG